MRACTNDHCVILFVILKKQQVLRGLANGMSQPKKPNTVDLGRTERTCM